MDDQILAVVNELKKKVDDLSTKVTALERRWAWLSGAAYLIVGAIGGPNAVQLITGGHS